MVSLNQEIYFNKVRGGGSRREQNSQGWSCDDVNWSRCSCSGASQATDEKMGTWPRESKRELFAL